MAHFVLIRSLRNLQIGRHEITNEFETGPHFSMFRHIGLDLSMRAGAFDGHTSHTVKNS